MTSSIIPDSLNSAQQQAVTAPLGHQLILAGAGSGKTRVLTQRITWLIQQEGFAPSEILAVTFTNKAANEMRQRVEALLGFSAKMLWIGTFHGLSHRILRIHYQEANLPETFQILDANDQYRLVRRVIAALNLDEKRWDPKDAQWFINTQKEEGLDPQQVSEQHNPHTAVLIKIYTLYQDTCQRTGVIDFADLLLKTHRLWQRHPHILAHYQQRFRYLLVDEFQDTNTIQYAWLHLLAGQQSHVMIVGDDDQSIYGWRGARVENLQRFRDDFKPAQLIRLEQNYRSTNTILKAANSLISRNKGRLGKNLWTQDGEGDSITLYAAFNDLDEASYIVHRIRERYMTGKPLRDSAILYRSNAQSRVIEETLMQFGIAYRVYGGLRFFDRAEIKDALAYLRLIANPHDDIAFERVINTPTRGIGDRTLTTLRDTAKAHQCALWQATEKLLQPQQLPARAASALKNFMDLILLMTEKSALLTLAKKVAYIIQQSALTAHFQQEKGEKALVRVENLEELVNAAQQFEQDSDPGDASLLTTFLAYAALESNEEQAGASQDSVQLMTLHAAKGLEFPVVFLAGCEEGLFPHYFSIDNPKNIEEERRLCYVGMTRAMRKLYMTYAESRRMHGKEMRHGPSRFLREVPAELVDEVRFRTKVSRPQHFSSATNMRTPTLATHNGKFYPGQTVSHRVFGQGVVLQCEGDGEDMKIRVRFERVGTKTLIASYLVTL
ncbi:MAG TPA: DNA helicase II [Gammaproteobacteria bacterium]|nr:MAG: DNA helicase II [Gammaproteobacteria bacterium RIFCSPHIGHO2_12_FULL_41_20]HLB43485.1 DNA helicase II [Gammaproteobacteria bacterium]